MQAPLPSPLARLRKYGRRILLAASHRTRTRKGTHLGLPLRIPRQARPLTEPLTSPTIFFSISVSLMFTLFPVISFHLYVQTKLSRKKKNNISMYFLFLHCVLRHILRHFLHPRFLRHFLRHHLLVPLVLPVTLFHSRTPLRLSIRLRRVRPQQRLPIL